MQGRFADAEMVYGFVLFLLLGGLGGQVLGRERPLAHVDFALGGVE